MREPALRVISAAWISTSCSSFLEGSLEQEYGQWKALESRPIPRKALAVSNGPGSLSRCERTGTVVLSPIIHHSKGIRMANIERIERVLDVIENNLPQWNQNVWGAQTDCGTQFCFAGFGMLDAGYQFVGRGGWGDFKTPEGEIVTHDFSYHGAKVFDLTERQANALFYEYSGPEGDIDSFRYFVSQVVGHNFYCRNEVGSD